MKVLLVHNINERSLISESHINKLVDSIGQALLGKPEQIKLALACLFARGHLLIEDLPGMGKTTLAHAIADVLGLSYNRVQFTSDLLPADLLGMSVFNAQKTSFEFHQGPIFTQLLLADEINRTTAKTQSALLEAMEEAQVSIDGKTRQLPSPFFVIATQNPQSSSGTFELPESQLDRFLMRIQLGYPSQQAERILLKSLAENRKSRQTRDALEVQLTPTQLTLVQEQASKVDVSEHLLDYVQRLIAFTRDNDHFTLGLSPRGAIALLTGAKAWALIEGRDYLLPEDVQNVFPSIAGHRLQASIHASSITNHQQLIDYVLSNVDVIHS
jgi:MoxR-like ATPase